MLPTNVRSCGRSGWKPGAQTVRTLGLAGAGDRAKADFGGSNIANPSEILVRAAVVLWGMSELVFEVTQEADGGYCAECLTESIFTEGATWDELRLNVLEATAAFFFDRPRPDRVRLRLVRDEVLLVA